MSSPQQLPVPEPIHFGAAEAPLLAWWHAPPDLQQPGGGQVRRTAVLLCGPWGDEDLGAYRGLHELACALAQAGLPVLRFDQSGEGDSFDPVPGPAPITAAASSAASVAADAERLNGVADDGRWPVWLASAHAAVELLRRRSGASRVALLGVRLGALLAAHVAAQRRDVVALVGLLPPPSGRHWVRETRMLGAQTGGAERADGGLVAGGFELDAATVACLSRLRWPGAAVSQGTHAQGAATVVPRALLVDRDDLPLPAATLQAWQAMAGKLDHRKRDDLGDLVAIAHSARLPSAARQVLVDWLLAVDATQRDAAAMDTTLTAPDTAPDTAAAAPLHATHAANHAPATSVIAQGVEESVVRIGRLVGVLSRPVGTTHPDTPTLLLLSSGAERRIGPHRLWVSLARDRARRGEQVLRLDLAGMGDSASRPGEPEADVYDSRSVQDIASAVAWLRAERGAGVITLAGICSGAYHAWRAALAGVPVQAVVPVNPLVFHWRSGMSLDPAAHAFGQIAISADAARAARDLQRWLKLLRGQVHVRVILMALLGRGWSRLKDLGAMALEALGMCQRDDLGRDLRQLARSGVLAHFIFAAGEPGQVLLKQQAGAALTRLLPGGRVQVSTIEQADHTFMLADGRRHFYLRLNSLLDGISHRTASPAPVTASDLPAVLSP